MAKARTRKTRVNTVAAARVGRARVATIVAAHQKVAATTRAIAAAKTERAKRKGSTIARRRTRVVKANESTTLKISDPKLRDDSSRTSGC